MTLRPFSETPAVRHAALAYTLLLALAGCQPGGTKADMPGDSHDHRPYGGIGENERLHFTGTEPFWSGEVMGGTLTYTTPDKPEGQTIAVSRFAGRGGLSYSGALEGTPLAIAITPGTCSDGMSDRSYPFVATLQLGAEVRNGCAWSDEHPLKQTAAP
jgi:uncharacterized membrane protein